ncbi:MULTISPECIES: hypothetical protein [Cyanophyceae]|uniref:hypothetical protein n=1 Tax=Cyanophyceae TaxID=3028117 RepID=UPI001687B0F6|nr:MULTISPECIES: hypothetical protein [Cyanophyceae]MBD1915336.1 hypothetical protein [Phormidium sp. FACHB-77]MBD2028900.1 hypothetical protein [Phormidium sp. FACHB-322]MBD2049348.1 hypothetical protein [Leptolyngbya sp. FACHB-60]
MNKTFDNQTFDRAFAVVATVAVGLAIAAGFWVLGTPGRQREIAADRQRLQDVGTIAQRLHERYLTDNDSFELPATLEASELRNDPLTNQPYEYERLSDREFNLCATFDTDSSTHRLTAQESNPDAERWQHPEGRHCFEFDVAEYPTLVY